MDVFDAIYQRRAVKHFDPGFEIPADQERKILEAALQAPTSFNIQHWRFVVIRDKALREKVKEFGFNQSQFTEASLLILLTADVHAWNKEPERYWRNAPEAVQKQLVGMIVPFHQTREWMQRDEAQRSMGMAAQTIMLAAKGLGYDSCPMIGYDLDKVAGLVKLPSDHIMGPMIAVGKRVKDPWPKPGQLPFNEVVFENSF